MNTRALLLSAAITSALASWASPAMAQSGPSEPGSSDFPMLGLGVDFRSTPNVYLPINVTPNLRIEPNLRLDRDSTSIELRDEEDGSLEGRQEETDTNVGFGVGVFYMFQPLTALNLYGGGRLRFGRTSSYFYREIEGGQTDIITERTTTQNSLTLGLGGGGEYFLTSRFSLGAEARLDFTNFGEPTVQDDEGEETPGDGDTTTRDTEFTTATSIFVRIYFL